MLRRMAGVLLGMQGLMGGPEMLGFTSSPLLYPAVVRELKGSNLGFGTSAHKAHCPVLAATPSLALWLLGSTWTKFLFQFHVCFIIHFP